MRTHQVQLRLAALVATQAAHSIEEYVGRMWEVHPLARFVSSLFSPDLEQGFAIGNVTLVTFGTWCVLWPVRRRWPSAARFAWLWVIVELANGGAHAAWSLVTGGYRPGLLTAPFLLVLALLLARELRNETRDSADA